MNFDCVQPGPGGQLMLFHQPFTVVEKIQLLQRSILVNSFAYYELNDNLLSDYKYDANCKQLEELAREYPAEYKRSRYYEYMYDFCGDGGSNGAHQTTGFDLISRIKKSDKELYNRIWNDAFVALRLKRERHHE